jgi:RHS repeat-associated protein
VTYQVPELGVQSWYSMTDHQLNDRSTLAVNNQTGNAMVQANDIHVNGLGLDLDVSRAYNAHAIRTTTLGKGWNLSVGPDVWLEQKDFSGLRFDYHTASGTVFGEFVRKSSDPGSSNYKKFSTPLGGADGDLVQNSDDSFTLTMHHNKIKYHFASNGSPSGDAFLDSIKDRNDNEIHVAYSGLTSGSVPKMSTITDASGRTYTVTYGSGTTANYVTKISNTAAAVGTREWSYTYSGDYLTGYTDPASKTTNYHYLAASPGFNLLDRITDPQMHDSVHNSDARPTTTLGYAVSDSLDINQVTSVAYSYGGGSDPYTYTWDYNDALYAACKGNGNNSTQVTDPNAHNTTYCFKHRTDTDPAGAKTWTYDAQDHGKSTGYTADNGPSNITSPSNQTAGGSTVATYGSGALSDQLNSVTEPKNGSSTTAASTRYSYGSSEPYQPSNVQDPSGDCTRYDYDSKGRTTDAYTGTAAGSPGAACPSTGGARFHRDYNNDGTVSASWDGNAGPSSGDSKKTLYTYWHAGDTGFVAGTEGQVKTIRKPGGDCSTGSTRNLCTSYTYDGAARVVSVTDGRGTQTHYDSDVMDRTTRAVYGATSCTPVTGANCVEYSYDDEGHMLSRSQGTQSPSTFGWDLLGRQVIQRTSAGGAIPIGTDDITYAYDAVGNLTSYSQLFRGNSADTVAYAYDSANRLTTVTDALGTTQVTTDDDGRTNTLTYPGSTGVKVDYDFTKSGKPKTLTAKNGAGTKYRQWDYDYDKQITVFGVTVTFETGQMQSRAVSNDTLGNENGKTTYNYGKKRLMSANDTNGTNFSYTYDDVNNVTSEQAGSTTTHYGYDKAGQLCWQGPTNDNPDPNDPTPLSCGTTPSGDTTLSHDAAGNNTNTSSAPISYNDRDQVATIDGVDQAYLDQGNDLRSYDGTTRTLQSALGITATQASSGAMSYFTRTPDGQVISRHDNDGSQIFVNEPNGSTAMLLSTTGALLGSYKYSPYGETTVTAGSGGTTASLNPFRYVGGYQNKTSTGSDGYYKLGARYYDTHGHFGQPDPADLPTGGYAYTGGDPINSSDPSGYKTTPTGSCDNSPNSSYAQVYCKSGGGGGTRNYSVSRGVKQLVGYTMGCAQAAAFTVGALRDNFILPYDPAESILYGSIACGISVVGASVGADPFEGQP